MREHESSAQTAAAHDTLARFAEAAHAAQAAETSYRAEAARQIAGLEAERIRAHRRVRLLRVLLASTSATLDETIAKQRAALADELGWHVESEGRKAVLDRLQPLSVALWREQCEAAGGQAMLDAALAELEVWYEGYAGASLYTLFDEYVPDAPVIDF